jgi:hypothetical protein
MVGVGMMVMGESGLQGMLTSAPPIPTVTNTLINQLRGASIYEDTHTPSHFFEVRLDKKHHPSGGACVMCCSHRPARDGGSLVERGIGLTKSKT